MKNCKFEDLFRNKMEFNDLNTTSEKYRSVSMYDI